MVSSYPVDLHATKWNKIARTQKVKFILSGPNISKRGRTALYFKFWEKRSEKENMVLGRAYAGKRIRRADRRR